MTRVDVFDGKYSVLLSDSPEESLSALRYGEPWRDCTGDNLVLLLASELHAAREERDRLAEEAKKAEIESSKDVADLMAIANKWRDKHGTAMETIQSLGRERDRLAEEVEALKLVNKDLSDANLFSTLKIERLRKLCAERPYLGEEDEDEYSELFDERTCAWLAKIDAAGRGE